MLKWLVIGIGDITTKRVIPALLEEKRSELWGIVTRDPGKAASYGVRAFTDLGAALAVGGADAVYVASPVFLHAPQTLASLRAGKQVLCEKPLAMNYAEARSMVEAAGAAGKTLGVAYYRRTYPKVARAKELLRQGAIGQPLLAYITCHDWRSGIEAGRAWQFDPALAGGGPLFDIGSHRIDVLNFLFGEPRQVAGQLSNAVHAMAVEDCATVMIEYASKVHGVVDVRWNSHVRRDEFRIIGSDGEMDLTPLNGPELVFPGGREDLPPHANLHFPCIENFVAAVLDGAPLLASGESSLWTDWVTEQAVVSSAQSRGAQVDPRPKTFSV
ncbi:MAG TPA: Gfo/Idh/MocA family oxidoreductase [Terriglobia bacterium]|nr:Gfo/Idh/MocA family oxidoreductase [Terriglobia bacterium]